MNVISHSTVLPNSTPLPLFDTFFKEHPESFVIFPPHYVVQETARVVFRRGFRIHNFGLFASRLNKSMVPYEGSREKYACSLFESIPTIKKYTSQPTNVTVCNRGRSCGLYPDFLLTTDNGIVFVDIKTNKHANRRMFLDRVEALTLYAQCNGIGYRFLTEKEIRIQRTENSLWLLSLARGSAPDVLKEFVWSWLKQHDGVSFGRVMEMTTAYPQVQSVIAGLALDGHLIFDWDKPLHAQSLLLQTEVI